MSVYFLTMISGTANLLLPLIQRHTAHFLNHFLGLKLSKPQQIQLNHEPEERYFLFCRKIDLENQARFLYIRSAIFN